MTAAHLNWLP